MEINDSIMIYWPWAFISLGSGRAQLRASRWVHCLASFESGYRFDVAGINRSRPRGAAGRSSSGLRAEGGYLPWPFQFSHSLKVRKEEQGLGGGCKGGALGSLSSRQPAVGNGVRPGFV